MQSSRIKSKKWICGHSLAQLQERDLHRSKRPWPDPDEKPQRQRDRRIRSIRRPYPGRMDETWLDTQYHQPERYRRSGYDYAGFGDVE